MEIHGPGKQNRTNPISESRRARPGSSTERGEFGAERSSDAVEFSNMGRILSNLGRVPEVRQARVDEVKALIASGDYDTEERLQVALERMLEELLGE